MAESHSIVVYIRAGQVQRVAFCECCPPVTVEVRNYEEETPESSMSVVPTKPKWPERLTDGRWRDPEGAYRAVVYEPGEE